MHAGETRAYKSSFLDPEIHNVTNFFLHKCTLKMNYYNDNNQKIVLSVLALCHIVCSNGLMADSAQGDYQSELFYCVFLTCFMSILIDAVLDLKFLKNSTYVNYSI